MSTTTATPVANPFQGMEGIKSETLVAEDKLRIAILGKPKTGKSWLAATAPKPIRYYDHDGRKESLEGKTDIFISSRPLMTTVETDLSIMKANKIKKLPLPATIVHDSVTFMAHAMEQELFKQYVGMYRTVLVGNTPMKIRQGWDAINGQQQYIEYLVAEYSALGVNIIFVYHERDEKDRAESTPNDPKYTGKVTADPQYLTNSLSLFNEVYRMTVDGAGKYSVTCRPNNDVVASTTMMLDKEEEPDIGKMIEKHRQKRTAMQKV